MLAPAFAGHPLPRSWVEAVGRDGFARVPGLLDTGALAAVAGEINRLTLALSTETRGMEERSTYDQAFLQVMNLWEHSAAVKRLVFDPGLAGVAAALLGVDSVRLYHDQSLYKEPGGGFTPAHADQYYWPMATERTITVWIPLQDVPAEMGPLGFYRGSHRRVPKMGAGRELPISAESEERIPALMAERGCEYCAEPFRFGDASFHLGMTFHRAGPNRSQSPRSVMTVIYADAEARLKSRLNEVEERDRLRWCPDVQPGELMAGAKNPVLYPV